MKLMKLIDADALHRKVKTETNPYGKPTIDYDSGVKVLEWIDKAPTIDAVPVVRCKDCKHCDPENHHCDHHMGTAAPLRRKPDDFCSYGERKEGTD